MTKAFRWYKKGADAGNPFCQLNVGNMLEYGRGIDINLSQALHYYELSATKNNKYANFFLGQLFEEGKGVEQDYVRAAEYFQRASECGDAFSSNKLGFAKFFFFQIGQEF